VGLLPTHGSFTGLPCTKWRNEESPTTYYIPASYQPVRRYLYVHGKLLAARSSVHCTLIRA
jgi:hypothetical protein